MTGQNSVLRMGLFFGVGKWAGRLQLMVLLLESGLRPSDLEYCVEKSRPPKAGGKLAISGERLQALAKFVGIPTGNEVLDFMMGALPNRNGASEQTFSLGGESQDTISAIRGVLGNFDQPSAFQWFQSCCQGGPIHGEQRGHGAHRRWFRPIQRHEQRKLSVGQVKGTQDLVESARQCAGGPLHMKAETAIPNQQGCFIRQFFRA